MDATAHVRSFNAAVAGGDWSQFMSGFASHARMEFVGPPVGPFVGRDAIARSYAADPPDDTIEISGPATHEGEELVLPYRWAATGATGTMRFTVDDDGLIARLVVTFD